MSLAALATGCSLEFESKVTSGDRGRATLAYADGCFLDCPVSRPMIVGTVERIGVAARGELPTVRAESSDPSKLTVLQHDSWWCVTSSSTSMSSSASGSLSSESGACPSGVTKEHRVSLEVITHAAGSAVITLREPGGAVFDTATLEVAVPARFDLQTAADRKSLAGVELAKGGSFDVRIDSYDARGRKLQASQGVWLSLEDQTIAAFADLGWSSTKPDGLATIHARPSATLRLVGRRPGMTNLVVSSPGARSVYPVTVRPEAAR